MEDIDPTNIDTNLFQFITMLRLFNNYVALCNYASEEIYYRILQSYGAPQFGQFSPTSQRIFSSFFSNLQISEKTIGQKNKEKNLGRAQIWPYLLEFEEFGNSKSIKLPSLA